MRGRPRESGYRNQFCILGLFQFQGPIPMWFEEIVNKTKLHRTVVARNLRALMRKGILTKQKSGRKMFYKIAVSRGVLEYILGILHDGGIQKVLKNLDKQYRKKLTRLYKHACMHANDAEKYEEELFELMITDPDFDPYVWTLAFAKERARTKKELKQIGKGNQIIVPKELKMKLRGSPPRKMFKKNIVLSTGERVTIRALTALEILEIKRKIEEGKRDVMGNPELREAMERLLS